MQADGIGRQSLRTITARNLAAQNRTDNAVCIFNRQRNRHRLFRFQIAFADIEQLTHIERFLQLMILFLSAYLTRTRLHLRLVQQRRQVKLFVFPVALLHRLRQQHLRAADHLVNRAEAQHSHIFAHLLRDKVHKVHHIFRLAMELFAQLRILRSNAHRTGVEIANAHHNAAQGYQRCRRKAKLLSAKQRRNNNIASCHQLAVSFQRHAVTQIIQKQRLMRFHQAQLPRQTGVVDGGTRRSTCAAVIAADKHHVSTRLNNACSNRAYAHLADQLHADTRTRIGILQVMNQLGQILDRINIMMRRRRNQANAGRRTTALRNPRINLAARELTALARLRALRNLNLNLVSVHQIVARYTKAAAGNLLNRAALAVAVRQRRKAVGMLAALARIALAAYAVHRNRQAFMCLLAQRAVAHRARLKAVADALHRLHLVDIDRQTLRRKGQHAAQILVGKIAAAQGFAELLKQLVIPRLAGLLQHNNRLRIEYVLFAIISPLIMRAGVIAE